MQVELPARRPGQSGQMCLPFGQTSEITFTEFARAWSVPPAEFAFTAPPGTKVLENQPGRR